MTDIKDQKATTDTAAAIHHNPSEHKNETVIPPETKTGFFKEFLIFVQKYGVIGLAIAVIIGQAVSKLTNSLVANILNPIISLILPSSEKLSEMQFYGIKYGAVLNDLLEFVMILWIVFVIIKYAIQKLLTPEEKAKLKID